MYFFLVFKAVLPYVLCNFISARKLNSRPGMHSTRFRLCKVAERWTNGWQEPTRIMACFLCIILLGAAYANHASAQETLPETMADFQDTWSSVFYCRKIYQDAAVRNRVYAGDLQACENADALIRGMAESRFSTQDRQIVEKNAVNKSNAIRYNTPSVQEAVAACRQQCRWLDSEYRKQQELDRNE